MSPAPSTPQPGKLAFLAAAFIFFFFLLFSYGGLSAYFTFDDGTAVVANLEHFTCPWWRNLLHILTVFTGAYRPLATLFWRPMYAAFGYNPLPYRIAIHLLLMLNICLAYVLARRFQATREAALLTTLVFCYNASMTDLYYDSCTVTDVMCFTFYALAIAAYIHGRRSGNSLSLRRAIAVVVCYALALDSKELAVAIPGILSIYELLYRRHDFRDGQKAKRLAGFLALLFAIGAIYLKVKVANMSENTAYRPHVTVAFMLENMGNYLHQLLYLPDKSVTAVIACLIVAGLIAVGALLRSRTAVFGALFFVPALIPVAVIAARSGYCAYIAYFGLALSIGAILAAARVHLVRILKLQSLESKTAVGLFLCVALLVGKGHASQWKARNGYWVWVAPQVSSLIENFRQTVPEFPPEARVLIAEDPWGGDWGPMFLIQLLYHDKTVWVDRPKNMPGPPDESTYDLVVSYKSPGVSLDPPRILGIPIKWQVRASTSDLGQFVMSSPAAHGPAPRVEFSPQAVRSRQTTTVTIPGLANVEINALYRIVSGRKSTRRLVKKFCTLDAKGSCTITAPALPERSGLLVVDWIQQPNQRWIFTGGVLTVVE